MTEYNHGNRLGCQVIFLAILMLFQIISAVRVLQLPESIQPLLVFPPTLQAILAIAWVLLFLIAIVFHLRGQQIAGQYSNGLIIGFFGYSLLRVIVFAQADYDRNRTPLLILVALVTVVPATIFFVRSMMDSKPQREGLYDSEYTD